MSHYLKVQSAKSTTAKKYIINYVTLSIIIKKYFGVPTVRNLRATYKLRSDGLP